jgi:UDP-3-O-[3-hydroxymyristoyl] glucosamine N-acyltransferase
MMVDRRFFPQAIPLSIATIVDLIGGEAGVSDPNMMVQNLTIANKAEAGSLCFATSEKIAASVANKKGVVCLASPQSAVSLGENITVIVTPQPKQAFVRVMREMYPTPQIDGGINPHAYVADDAIMGEGVRIDAGATIAKGVELGAGVWIKAGVSIGEGCVIGADTIIDQNAVIAYALIGSGCQIGFGVAIGSSGFGIDQGHSGNATIPHLGRVIIGDDCLIGANSTIDRGFIDDTVIGSNVMIDNLVHIAHNVKIGLGNIICGQSGIAGSTELGDNNVIGGQSGIVDHVSIGSGNTFVARTCVTKNIGDNKMMAGFPAVSLKEFHHQAVCLRQLASAKRKMTEDNGG